MKLILKIIAAILANALGLYLAAHYIPGFVLSGGAEQLFGMAIILSVLNFVLKPILKIVLGPVIILTLGLGLIVVNVLVLYSLDIISNNLTIETVPALFFATILLGIINLIFHVGTPD